MLLRTDDTSRDATLRDRVARLTETIGERATLRQLAISRHVLYRVLAGLPVRRGSIALIEAALARIDDEERNTGT